jgi:toxin-antitoxin system PIN domain toxin
MTILDANVLLYAYNADAPQHRPAARWLRKIFQSGETIGLPWMTLWAFVRIGTNSRIWENPLAPKEAFVLIRQWLAEPGVLVVQPGPRHAQILEELVLRHGAAGPLLTDAALAALAIEHGAILASTDQDFRRFPGLSWMDPLGES